MIRLVTALLVAAVLEAGGNALLRQGLLRSWWPLLVAGIITLGVYGLLVNQSGLNFDFGRLMGCYIVAFFLISQVLAGAYLPRRSVLADANRRDSHSDGRFDYSDLKYDELVIVRASTTPP